MKTRDPVKGFHLFENSHKFCRGFHQAMKAQRTCFITFIKLFSVLTKKKTSIQSPNVYFNFFNETVNSHNLKAANHVAYVIFDLHDSAIKTYF